MAYSQAVVMARSPTDPDLGDGVTHPPNLGRECLGDEVEGDRPRIIFSGHVVPLHVIDAVRGRACGKEGLLSAWAGFPSADNKILFSLKSENILGSSRIATVEGVNCRGEPTIPSFRISHPPEARRALS